MKTRAVSLRTRLILTYLAVFLVSAAVLTGIAGTLYGRQALTTAKRNLEVQAFLAASALSRPWLPREVAPLGLQEEQRFQTLTNQFDLASGAQLTVLDAQGEPVATSLSVAPLNQAAQPEVRAALDGTVRHDVRFDPASAQVMIFAAAPVRRLPTRVSGVVQVSLPFAEVQAQVRRFWLSLAGTALLAALAAAFAAWWLALQLAKPVRMVRDAATHLAEGRLSERVSEQETGHIAELAQLAGAFNHMADRIQDVLNRQREFVANASHELRTPLTNIKLRAEALRTGALEDPPIAARFAADIEGEADRLARMAQGLLTLAQQDAAAPLMREPIEPETAVRDALREMSLRASHSAIRLEADFAPNLPLLNADPVGLRTILINLIDNALQYTLAGGLVRVSVRPDELAGQPALVLQVADTGAGIPPADLPHIFERFYRADKARSRRTAHHLGAGVPLGSGAGLGLAIAQAIVATHKGTIAAESTVGQGTTMTVTLPISTPS